MSSRASTLRMKPHLRGMSHFLSSLAGLKPPGKKNGLLWLCMASFQAVLLLVILLSGYGPAVRPKQTHSTSMSRAQQQH